MCFVCVFSFLVGVSFGFVYVVVIINDVVFIIVCSLISVYGVCVLVAMYVITVYVYVCNNVVIIM